MVVEILVDGPAEINDIKISDLNHDIESFSTLTHVYAPVYLCTCVLCAYLERSLEHHNVSTVATPPEQYKIDPCPRSPPLFLALFVSSDPMTLPLPRSPRPSRYMPDLDGCRGGIQSSSRMEMKRPNAI